ncbi:MAG: hypothetical protein J7K00_01155 [Candidatus Diapherotrites archaeon]|nr:hypothetical protein [Candidatus Diapherotrites archaeon]
MNSKKSRSKALFGKRGQSQMIAFPILFAILLVTWVLLTYSFYDSSNNSQKALNELNDRHRIEIHSSFSAENLPGPTSSGGHVKNSGEITFTNTNAILVPFDGSNSTHSKNLGRIIPKQTKAVSFDPATITYGDIVILRSVQTHLVSNILPLENKASG